MSATRSFCVSLELEFDDERIGGRLEDEQGNSWRFSSWLDLLTLIERMPAGASSQAFGLSPPSDSVRLGQRSI
jgi:hypothetical protein